jgi:hypothetical protein
VLNLIRQQVSPEPANAVDAVGAEEAIMRSPWRTSSCAHARSLVPDRAFRVVEVLAETSVRGSP